MRVFSGGCAVLMWVAAACGAAEKEPGAAKEGGPTPSASAQPSAAEDLPTSLVALIAELKPASSRLTETAASIAQSGNAEAIRRAADRLVGIAARLGGPEVRAEKRAEIDAANRTAGVAPPPEQIERRIDAAQLAALEPVYAAMEALGGEVVADFALREAADGALPIDRRERALRVAERHAADPDRAAKRAAAAEDIQRIRAQAAQSDPRAEMAAVIAGLQPGLEECIKAAMARKPRVAASGLLVLRVGPAGKVEDASTIDVGPPELAACVQLVGRGAKFPASKDGKPQTVRLPVRLATQ
jgi:hypothetical protein